MPSSLPRGLWRALRIGVLAAATVLAAAYVAAAWRLQRADRGWAASFESMDAFAARHPKRAASASAVELDALARPLGIRLRYRQQDFQPGAPRDRPNQDVLMAIGRSLTQQDRAANDVPQDLPADAREFLDRNAASIEAIEKHLVEAGPIEWEQDIDRRATPIPGLLGHRHLQNILLARSLEADRARRAAEVERSLEASWRLNQSLLQRPELISQLLASAIASMQHGALRRVSAVPPIWKERLTGQDLRAQALTAFQGEAYAFSLLAREFRGIFDVSELDGSQPRANSAWVFLGRLITAPYLRLSLANYSDELRVVVEQLRAADRCQIDLERIGEDFTARLPRWNVIGRIAGAPLARAWAIVPEVSFDAERTRLVLEERAAPGEPGWPRRSAVCGQVRWLREATVDGRVVIHPDVTPFPETKEPRDWSFTLAARGR